GLSFVPPGILGGTGDRLFPTGNLVGTVGTAISLAAWRFFGVSAFLIPALPAIWAAAVLGRIDRSATVRLSALVAGVMARVPALVHALTNPLEGEAGAGRIGPFRGAPLLGALGWAGATILIGFLPSFLSVATIGWNPIRAAMRGSQRAFEGSKVAAGALGQVVDQLRTGELSAKGPLRWAKESATLGARPAATDPSARDPSDPLDHTTDDASFTAEYPTGFTAPDAADEVPDDAVVHPTSSERRRRAPATSGPQRPTAEAARAALFDSGDATAGDLPSTGLLTAPPPRDEARNRQHL